MKPIIDKARCDGCGSCVNACPASLFKLEDGKAIVVEGECIGCKACENICPKGAIRVETE